MAHNAGICKTTAYALKKKNNFPCLKVGCSNVDACLRNGLKPGHGIVEVAGEASSGKTQFCLQLALNSLLPLNETGPKHGILYIFCEGTFPINRLKDLANNKYGESVAKILLELIFVEHVDDVDQLWTLLDSKMFRASLASGRIKTVIVDSITAIIRGEFGSSRQELVDRSDAFFTFSSRMKYYSSLYCCLFVVINQVSSVVSQDSENNRSTFGNHHGMDTSFVPNGQEARIYPGENVKYASSTDSLKVTPSLGISWSTCVNTRILLRRLSGQSVDNQQVGTNENKTKVKIFRPIVRELRVLLSPILPFNSFCYFTVTKEGLVNV